MSELTPEPSPTGHPEVDAVLLSLDDLSDSPVKDHVVVFEAAHERLRGVLADGDTPARR